MISDLKKGDSDLREWVVHMINNISAMDLILNDLEVKNNTQGPQAALELGLVSEMEQPGWMNLSEEEVESMHTD